MKSRHLALAVAALFALAACDSKVQTSVPADSAPAASAAAAPAGLVEGQNYTVLANPIPQQQAGKVEVLEFFGYFCPHCAHLEPVLSKHAKSFKDDMYLRTEHVVWQKEMLPLARLAAAVDMAAAAVDMAAADSKDVANSHIFDAMVNQKIKLQNPEVLKKWLGEQTAFDGKKVLAAYESPESQARADKMQELTETFQIDGTPTVIVGGKYKVEFADWESGMHTIDLLADKVREEQKAAQ
ncbi:thiol:disulfide interchange protein DsbA/DsbL [Neisseria bergeri]|uniref:thiol:disulfide interchange protein DsbA/DsbL n=1 Tax=Neisseria bergeri TaxID=1906581 RepID=UPI00272B6BD9|nr:thiol:disulfide interchange protein DsbA/DsbL [Neisseria bergeri]